MFRSLRDFDRFDDHKLIYNVPKITCTLKFSLDVNWVMFAFYLSLISFFRWNESEIYLHDPKSLFTFVINQSNKIEKRSEFSNTLKNARGRP